MDSKELQIEFAKKKLGSLLTDARNELGLTLEEMTLRFDKPISRQYLSLMETGDMKISLKKVESIIEIYFTDRIKKRAFIKEYFKVYYPNIYRNIFYTD
jgi:transcriptional regulator with XRE-family HTH domain